MFNWIEIRALIQKEFLIEKRSKNILMSTLLYVFSASFICYIAFSRLDANVWNGLAWIIILFALTNAANRIFMHESGSQRMYIYSLARSSSIIVSKIVYQWISSALLSALVVLIFSLLFNQGLPSILNFTAVLFLGVWAMSNVLTLNNALSANTPNSPTVLAILSFPILLPVFLTTIRASSMAMAPASHPDFTLFLGVLGLLNVLTLVLSILLFQYLWRY